MSLEESISSEDFHDDLNICFITSPQYTALTEHFTLVLKDIEECKNIKRVRVEFLKLFDIFQRCYMESQRKTLKIRELMALNIIEAQKVENVSTHQVETEKYLKGVIMNLQRELDILKEHRNKLLAKVKLLKKPAEKVNKVNQVDFKMLKQLPTDDCERKLEPLSPKLRRIFSRSLWSELTAKQNERTKSICRQSSENGLKVKETMEGDDISILKANLKVLVADLKITRKKISDLKTEITRKDKLVKKYSKGLSESEIRLTQVQKRILEVQKPLEVSIRTYKTELEYKKRKYQEVHRDLQQAVNLNTKLTKENETKDCMIQNLTLKLKETISEKDTSARKSNLFEEHLAASQVLNEASKYKIRTLEEEVEKLLIEINFKEACEVTSLVDKVKKAEEEDPLDHETENYKNQIAIRDRRLNTVEKELKTTYLNLKKVRADLNSVSSGKTCVESEVRRLNVMCKERACDIKLLKEKLCETKREAAVLRKDLQIRTVKLHQALEKKNKFHNLYVQLKLLNNQDKIENTVLMKRQESLLKILKDKEVELKKLVKYNRYGC